MVFDAFFFPSEVGVPSADMPIVQDDAFAPSDVRSPFPEITAAQNSGREITSITNMFLSTYSEQTIGVTGTKGKSTTASLIYQILKAANKKVYLVGNIGHDPLEHLLEKRDKQKINQYKSFSLSSQASYLFASLNSAIRAWTVALPSPNNMRVLS